MDFNKIWWQSPCGDGIHDVQFTAMPGPIRATADAVNLVATGTGPSEEITRIIG